MKYFVLGALCVAIASEARAEIVVFKNGRTMSVKSHTIVADMATLAMRDGGEVTFPASIIERVDPDEVPYPEPTVADTAEVPQAPKNTTAVNVALVPDEVLKARPFADVISTVAAAHDLDARLVHAVIEQESNYQARARSQKGARGLMQLMPAVEKDMRVANVFDPRENILGGTRLLRVLANRYEGDLVLTIAAYHAGQIGRAHV